MTIIDLIIEIVQNFARLQKKNGSFPGGCNGPYHDYETPIRNTSHLIILLSRCYRLTNNKVFLDRLFKAAEYLCSREARPFGYTFHHRNNKKKDKCNGLIGQAWTFEALAEASKILEDEKYLLLAEEVFLKHTFNNDLCLWQILEIDGTASGIDKTFNHQLWFATCALMIYENKTNIEQLKGLEKFIDSLPKNLNTLKSGLILHPVKLSYVDGSEIMSLKKRSPGEKTKNFLKYIYRRIVKNNERKADNYNKMIHKSFGYHSFNMYAFALLKQQIPSHKFWNSELFGNTINYMLTSDFKNNLNENIYSYPYNPAGFEIPFALSILDNIDDRGIIEISKSWINEQIQRCYNRKTKMMDRNTSDPLTLTARTYELCRLPIDILDKIDVEII